MELTTWFKEFYIHESAWDSATARRARAFLKTPAVKVQERPYSGVQGPLGAKDFDHSKERIYLGPHSGHFFRKCPGTQGAACCNYFVLNLGAQCPMNCSYCYLQSYINSPMTQIYTNIEDALQELEAKVADFPRAAFRVGTGEVIDSLALDDLTGHSEILVEWFSRHPLLSCEFKTKSDNIKNFVHKNHSGNVVVSFSVNPSAVAQTEEHRTASLPRRLAAARLARDNGFPVAFHIDPMMAIPEWEKHYSELVEQITSLFKPIEIKWISVGALRYQPEMKDILRDRFGGSTHSLTGEMFLSRDGKLRYDLRLRNKMFRHVVDGFKKVDAAYAVFLCMETPESWLGTFEKTPRLTPGLKELFDPMPAI